MFVYLFVFVLHVYHFLLYLFFIVFNNNIKMASKRKFSPLNQSWSFNELVKFEHAHEWRIDEFSARVRHAQTDEKIKSRDFNVDVGGNRKQLTFGLRAALNGVFIKANNNVNDETGNSSPESSAVNAQVPQQQQQQQGQQQVRRPCEASVKGGFTLSNHD